jgi:hypothetical protein
MQAINESLEHGKKAEAYAEQARQKDDFPDSEMAWIESNLAVAKAITGLALAVLAHDGNVAAQQVAEADRGVMCPNCGDAMMFIRTCPQCGMHEAPAA